MFKKKITKNLTLSNLPSLSRMRYFVIKVRVSTRFGLNTVQGSFKFIFEDFSKILLRTLPTIVAYVLHI